ncbi:MAG: WYL domain-containing protein [Streptosporangiales bacterium]|nr:WYL domain-containing protein [Streptosporangiales bacterium]
MRASRLLSLLLLLQTRQRVTTAELAGRLEVSRRTVLRDVEALSAAGVPVYAERGRHGGIVLLPGSRLNASHLEPVEMEALVVAGLDARQRDQLGLAGAHETATRKIEARRAAPEPGSSNESLRLADLIVVDNTAWLARPAAGADIGDLALDLRRRGRLEIRYRRSAESRAAARVVDPYGLASKSGRWYLVADSRGSGRLFAIERLESYRCLAEPARLRAGQTLGTVWAGLKDRVEEAGAVAITARLEADQLDRARRILGTRIQDVAPAAAGWCRVTIRYPELEAVRQLLQFADHIEIVAPPEARERLRELAADLAARHR